MLWRLKRCVWSAMAIIILLVSIIPLNAPLKQHRSWKDDKAINNFIQGNMRAPPAVPVEEGAARERCGTNWEEKVIWGREAMSEYWCHPPPRVHEWPSVTSSEQHCLANQTVTPLVSPKETSPLHARVHTNKCTDAHAGLDVWQLV